MSTYYHIDSSKDVTIRSLESKKIEQDIQAFLAIEGNEIDYIPTGVGAGNHKGNSHYRTTKAT